MILISHFKSSSISLSDCKLGSLFFSYNGLNYGIQKSGQLDGKIFYEFLQTG